MNVRKILKNPTPGMYIAAIIVVVMVIALLVWAIGTSRDAPVAPSYVPASPSAGAGPDGPQDGPDGVYGPIDDDTTLSMDLTPEELQALEAEQANLPKYLNNKVLSYAYNEAGDTFSLGIDLGGAGDEAIYLNPSTTASQAGTNVGYYISTSYMWPTYQQREMDPAIANTQYDQAILSGYDNSRPTAYQDKAHFGVSWSSNASSDGPRTTEVFVRAITMADSKLLATCKARVEYDPDANTYQLADLEGTDVRATGYLSATERAELLDWSYALVSSGILPKDGGAGNRIEGADKAECISHSTVEYTDSRVYFPKLYNIHGRLTPMAEFTGKYRNLVAVSLDTGSRGFMTLYFSPDGEGILDWFSDVTDLPTWISLNSLTSKNLYLAGWDEYEPRSSNEKIFK